MLCFTPNHIISIISYCNSVTVASLPCLLPPVLSLAVVLGVAWCAAALYDSSDDVVELTGSNFQRLVLQGDEVWLVEFYAPW